MIGPHHDGSELYVPVRPALGATVPVLVRVPHDHPVERIHLRSTYDGDTRIVPARPVRRDAEAVWWQADLLVHNPRTRYRFRIDESWLHAGGLVEHDPTDATDFQLTVYGRPPAWLRDAVIYQIFPDRFARSGRVNEANPGWAVPAAWDEPVVHHGPDTGRQLYGGDLHGVTERLDHLAKLGVDVLYLTPFFPAGSNHRYDAATFEHVDPLLGGDAALIELTTRAHRRGMRVIGDLTTNHTGASHEWFPERGAYYYLREDGGYASWFGVPSLPKLNWGSPELRAELARVAGRWLREPYNLDGWRVDVANMTGRLGAEEHNQAAARTIRAALPDGKLLIAEHFHDHTADVPGDGWHAVMNYAGFAKPVWSWLTPGSGFVFPGEAGPLRPRAGRLVARTMREFAAAVPWSVSEANVNLISSHDVPRARTTLGSDALVAVAAGLLMTYPGTPMLFMGDEFGLEGLDGEHARTPMPWDREPPPLWEVYRDLIALRRSSHALRHGGLRWGPVGDDVLVFLRESPRERLLVLAARAPYEPLDLPLGPNLYGGADQADGFGPTFQVWRLAQPAHSG
ncbi:glycoside hydrolase family 13 protein [Nonomuraea sp. NPDC050310]|uniref:glycoside hydrolase family 13 protein n=1 Tax=Nonomuraea sp. NPDC050310 TaxID=3154935 RepID=UPI0033F77848